MKKFMITSTPPVSSKMAVSDFFGEEFQSREEASTRIAELKKENPNREYNIEEVEP